MASSATESPASASKPRWLGMDKLEQARGSPSSSKDRIRSITQKLSKLQSGLEADKKRSRTAVESRMQTLDERFAEARAVDEMRFQEYSSHLEQLAEGLATEVDEGAVHQFEEHLAGDLLAVRRRQHVAVAAAGDAEDAAVDVSGQS